MPVVAVRLVFHSFASTFSVHFYRFQFWNSTEKNSIHSYQLGNQYHKFKDSTLLQFFLASALRNLSVFWEDLFLENVWYTKGGYHKSWALTIKMSCWARNIFPDNLKIQRFQSCALTSNLMSIERNASDKKCTAFSGIKIYCFLLKKNQKYGLIFWTSNVLVHKFFDKLNAFFVIIPGLWDESTFQFKVFVARNHFFTASRRAKQVRHLVIYLLTTE